MKDQLTRAHSGLCSPTLQPPAIQGQTGSSPFLTPQTQSPTFRGQLSKLAPAYNAKFLCPDQLPQAKENPTSQVQQGPAGSGTKTHMSLVLNPQSVAQTFLVDFCTVSGTGPQQGIWEEAGAHLGPGPGVNCYL